MALSDADIDRIAERVTDLILHTKITVPDAQSSTVDVGTVLGGLRNDLRVLRSKLDDDFRRTVGV